VGLFFLGAKRQNVPGVFSSTRLAPESQPIQAAIDAVLFQCYGLSEDDAKYIEKRRDEML